MAASVDRMEKVQLRREFGLVQGVAVNVGLVIGMYNNYVLSTIYCLVMVGFTVETQVL